MSRFLILGLFILVSCAGDNQPEPSSIGSEREFDPQQVSDDRFKIICAALDNKVDALKSMTLPTDFDYTFSYADKGCKDKEPGAPRDVKTKIVAGNSDDSFIFKMENNDSFYFSNGNVETGKVGIMSYICNNPAGVMNPVQISSTSALYFSLGMDSSICESDGNSICVYFQRGTFIDSKRVKIHTEEWIKFKMMNPRRGFFTERIMKSSANCSDTDYNTKTAVLK